MSEHAGSTATRHRVARWAGEFVVIVAGVLAALAAEAWWQGRQDAEERTRYLVALSEDMATDSATFERYLSELDVARSRALEVLDLLDAGELPPEVPDFIALVQGIRGHRPLSFRRGTFEQMVATGSLSLLGAGELSRGVAQYYVGVDLMAGIHERFAGPLPGEEEALLSFGYRTSLPPDRRPSSQEYYDYLRRQPGSREVIRRIYAAESAEAVILRIPIGTWNEQLRLVRSAIESHRR